MKTTFLKSVVKVLNFYTNWLKNEGLFAILKFYK